MKISLITNNVALIQLICGQTQQQAGKYPGDARRFAALLCENHHMLPTPVRMWSSGAEGVPALSNAVWFSLCCKGQRNPLLPQSDAPAGELGSHTTVCLTHSYLNVSLFGRARCVHTCVRLFVVSRVCLQQGRLTATCTASIIRVSVLPARCTETGPQLVGLVLTPLLRHSCCVGTCLGAQ